jgi:organic hydroperoxide reductase OsmC/OhrA
VPAFPQKYEVSIRSHGAQVILESASRPQIEGGAPPEFGGDANVWSPEHLLVASVGLCLFTTFRALATRGGTTPLDFSWRDRIDAVLEKTSSGLRFTGIVHRVEIGVAETDRARAAQLMQRAQPLCIIANTLNVAVKVETVLVPR